MIDRTDTLIVFHLIHFFNPCTLISSTTTAALDVFAQAID